MSDFYKPVRTYSLYIPGDPKPYRLSRSRIDSFLSCKRCFYMDRKLGVEQPPMFPFTLNSAVDKLLKKEFDIHRANGKPHPLMTTYGVDAVPLKHSMIESWRDYKRGIAYHHKETNFHVFGAVDDVWATPSGELIIVDYKSTSKVGEVNLDAGWQDGYKRQMEVYQWLFRKNGFKVSPTGYFVYCNGQTDREAFDAKLEFTIRLIPYTGDDSWVEPTIKDIHECLNGRSIPEPSPDCDYCRYRQAVSKIESRSKPGQVALF